LQPRTLAIDVGGSHVKAIVLAVDGTPLSDAVLIATPHPCPPEPLCKIVEQMVASLPQFKRVSGRVPGFCSARHDPDGTAFGHAVLGEFRSRAGARKRAGSANARAK